MRQPSSISSTPFSSLLSQQHTVPPILLLTLHIGQKFLDITLTDIYVVTVRLQPIGSAPHLNQRVFKLSTNQQFATIVRFLRKRLGVKEHESVFCYVGSVFSPALDEGVGNLWTVSWFVLVASEYFPPLYFEHADFYVSVL